ncbi:hypothetical protein CWE08_08420 [Aliidiomarina iranensis]|uniref:YaeQ family protein n=1 Tax=Aliidiomarina iranensis TaxID=1434071 RepID=A0A432VTV3_9GAMM|nr:YaeQ family protein [Aliidiomarina iranensis]RUO19934.1 hypothetical protein CWE08_08420 [Aliidiomarina iranensis]
MALQSTPYKIALDISDTDRGCYEQVKFTIARHPSETELRLVARILAFGLFYHERLEFGRGLSETEEPALWQKALHGDIEHWIDVGQPDLDRITKGSRKGDLYSLLVYGNSRVWIEKTLPTITNLSNVNIIQLPSEPMDELTKVIARNTHWGIMVTDNVVYVSHGDGQTVIELTNLKALEA